MNRRDLHELMHCCRPDLSDLAEDEARALAEALEQDPQLRTQWEALQNWDRAIAREMQDVPVPAGLAERLVAAATAVGPIPRSSWQTTWLSSFPTRLAASVLATAALVLLAVWLAGWRDTLTATQLAERSRGWIKQLNVETWLPTQTPVAGYPVDPGVLRLNVGHWQACSTLVGHPAVVYRADLPPDHGVAFLFVIRRPEGKHLPTIPPTQPDSTTGSVCIGVWKSNDCVYVLAVYGTPADYLRTLRTQSVA